VAGVGSAVGVFPCAPKVPDVMVRVVEVVVADAVDESRLTEPPAMRATAASPATPGRSRGHQRCLDRAGRVDDVSVRRMGSPLKKNGTKLNTNVF
jgi:transcription initiation factor TFIID subunit TAF12